MTFTEVTRPRRGSPKDASGQTVRYGFGPSIYDGSSSRCSRRSGRFYADNGNGVTTRTKLVLQQRRRKTIL